MSNSYNTLLIHYDSCDYHSNKSLNNIYEASKLVEDGLDN